MKLWHVHIFVAFITFTVGLAGAWLFLRPQPTRAVQCLESLPQAEANPAASETESTTASKRTAADIDIKNPYSIAVSLDGMPDVEVGELWERLGIVKTYQGYNGQQSDGAFFTNCPRCRAEAFEFDMDGDAENEVIVRVANGIEECRYLVFKKDRSKEGYKLAGHFDHDFGRYQMPVHHFVLSRGKAYMVVRVQAASGSGVAAYMASILVLRNGRLIELMSFPSDGHQAMLATLPSREYGGRVLDISEVDRRTRIELGLTVKYEVYGQNDTVTGRWTKHAKAVYIKPHGAREAYLDTADSTISQKQIDAEYNIDSLSDEDLVRYNRSQLRAAGWKPPGTR
jgi:hypothetical protein